MTDTLVEKSGELAVLDQPLKAEIVYSLGGIDSILERLRAEVLSIPTDISTAAGRKQVASLAYKVARSKTTLDDLGKNLVADWKQRAAAVDADRRRVREELDALRDEVRKPLTDWESAEQARVTGHEAALAALANTVAFDAAEPPIGEIEGRLMFVEQFTREWQEFAGRGATAKREAVAALTGLLARRKQQEQERAELARLKAENEAREKAEREARIAQEAADKARKEAEEKAAREAKAKADQEAAERRRIQDEAAARERLAQAAREKAERDAAEAEARARRAEQEKEAAIDAERARVAAEQEKARKEAEARERDKKHKAAVNNAALTAISKEAGIGEDAAKAVVGAIAKGLIPNVSISY
jgi:hypothetical protein